VNGRAPCGRAVVKRRPAAEGVVGQAATIGNRRRPGGGSVEKLHRPAPHTDAGRLTAVVKRREYPGRRAIGETDRSHLRGSVRGIDETLEDPGIVRDPRPADSERERGRRGDRVRGSRREERDAVHFRIRGKRNGGGNRKVKARHVARAIGRAARGPVARGIPIS